MLFGCDATVTAYSLVYACRASIAHWITQPAINIAPYGAEFVVREFKWNADDADYADFHCEASCNP